VSGFSPLERRALLALISLIRDREPNPEEWSCTDVPLSALYEHLHTLRPGQSHELQRKYQRQATRRALGRLHRDDLIWPLALAWVSVTDNVVIRWQGGGSRKQDGIPGGIDTPRWKLVGLTAEGVTTALLLERETTT
jgi:hypothetical protein